MCVNKCICKYTNDANRRIKEVYTNNVCIVVVAANASYNLRVDF